MNYTKEKLDYLLKYYSMEQIHKHCDFSNRKLEKLWQSAQPYEVNIEELSVVNDGKHLYLVDSPDGFVPIDQWRNKGIKRVYETILENGYSIKTSENHLFQKENEDWIYTKNIKLSDCLLTDVGSSRVVSNNFIGEEVVYDLAVGHDNHRYYTNNVSSHNSGKSLFLQNISLNWTEAGKNVVYISLELSESLIDQRFFAMVSKRGTKAIFKDIDETAFEVAVTGKKSGKLYIKRMKEGSCTNDIRAYLKEFEIKTGIKPDAVVLDYLDLLHPNNRTIDVSNLFVKDKYTSEEFRGLLEEFEFLSCTASQLNRSSVEVDGQFTQAHIAGGISKINTADNAFGIHTNAMMKENGEYECLVLKGRTSDAVGHTIKFSYNVKTMRIGDLEEDFEKPSSKASLKKELKEDKKKPSLMEQQEEEQESKSVLSMMERLKKKKEAASKGNDSTSSS